MSKKFNKLTLSPHWQQYFSKYPDGYTIIENLIDWISQVNKMVDSYNELTDHVDNFKEAVNNTTDGFRGELDVFLGQFDDNLTQTVITTLTEWQNSGFLDVVIDEALNTKLHEMDNRFTARFNQNVNAKSPLVTPTYDGSYQSVHPKVLVFPQGWNGHIFWMAMTPYTNTNDKTENPSILVSDDSYRWYEPEGIENPVSGIPNPGGGGHYSDTHLVMADNVMELWYRYNPPLAGGQGNDNNTNIIYKQTSTDGVNWSEKEIIFHEVGYQRPYVSPSIIYEGGLYKIWWNDYDWQIFYQESSDGYQWSEPVLNTTDLPSNVLPWHGDVIRHGNGYEMVMSCKTGDNIFELYYLESSDGINWENGRLIISPSLDSNFMDNLQIYRASIVRAYGLVKIYYSSTTRDGRWFTSLTEGKTVDMLQGYNGQPFFPQVLHNDLYLKDVNYLYLDQAGNSGMRNNNNRITIFGGTDGEFSNDEGRLSVTKPGVRSTYYDHDGVFFTGHKGGTSLKDNELMLGTSGNYLAMLRQSTDTARTVQVRSGSGNASAFVEAGGIYFTGSYGLMEEKEGTMRYNATSKKMEFYNGTAWETIQSS